MYTFEYETGPDGSDPVTFEQLRRFAEMARQSDINWEMLTESCDDDHQAYPGGHWIAAETSSGSNSWAPLDCTSGEGGAAGLHTSNGGGCCTFEVNDLGTDHIFETWPFPHRICGSINTGGGVIFAFSTNDLRFG
eukprot:SAG31_NODE_5419_length_2548_cov_1.752552_2_plen_135_part_00